MSVMFMEVSNMAGARLHAVESAGHRVLPTRGAKV